MSDDRLAVAIELNERARQALRDALAELTDEEAAWRPLPVANNVALIVRHLRIESDWHLASLTQGTPLQPEMTDALQKQFDAVTHDVRENLTRIDDLTGRFVEALRSMSIDDVRSRTRAAYGDFATTGRHHLIAYHQAMHLWAHIGQIRSIRNLYRKTRGEPQRFFPDNPSYPR